MTRARLTLDMARVMNFDELSKTMYGLLEPFEAAEIETPSMLETRIGKTLDELPDIYAWMLQLHAFFDHWVEWQGNQYGMKSLEYKEYRIKRDLAENVAKAAKLRYEGTSRRLTQISAHEAESRMPRGR